jgi:hypothetical protein
VIFSSFLFGCHGDFEVEIERDKMTNNDVQNIDKQNITFIFKNTT